jgi:predicted SpoU family rRNA methylase
MKEKLIAGLMAALTALTTVYPVLAATLADFPSFLGKPVDDFLIVIGAQANPADVAGAADVAIALAVQSTEEVAVPGAATTVTGKEAAVPFDTNINDDTNGLGTDVLTQTQIPFLKRETISYEDQSSWLVEEITVPDAPVKHDSELNGTVYVDLSAASTPLEYKVKFTTPIKLAGSYDKLFKVNLFGQEFSILNVTADNTLKILTGTTGTITPTTGLTYGEYTLYSDMGAADGSWVRVNIMKGDSKVDTLYVNKGSTATSSVTGLDVTLTGAWVSADNVVLRADVVVGPKGKTLKDYTTDDAFPLNDYWTFDIQASNAGQTVTYIGLKYNVNETNRYLKAGEKVIVPNNYFELGFDDLAIKDYAKLTITTGRTTGGIYDISNPDTKLTGELPAIVITADKPVFNGESSSKAYIAYNESNYFRLAYYDESLGKIVSDSSWTNSSITSGIIFSGKYDKHTFTVSYQNDSMPAYLTITTQDTDGPIQSLFTYDSSAKKFILGNTEGEAEGVDVMVNGTEKGTQEWQETLNYGTIIEGIKSNSALNKVVIDIPADQQKAKVYVGKLGGAAAGATYVKYTPVTMPVARLDTELTATDKTKNLVVVGGPCVNKEAYNALNITSVQYPACGAASTIPENAAIIKIVPDYPATGKYTVVVAGWEAANTRTACAVVQQYATLLKGQAVSAVKVTSATTAGITPL